LAFFPTTETASIGSRLEGLKSGQNKPNTTVALRDQDEMNKSIVSRMILPILDRLSKVMSGILPAQTMNELKIAIVQAGLTNSINPAQIMVASYLLMVALPFILLVFTGMPDGLLSEGSAILVLGALLGWKFPGMMIKGRATTRKHQIQKDLPFVLDLISISVEAGMALDGALAIVTEKTTGPLTDELNQSLREMRLGKGRNDALIDMSLRLGVDDLKSFITAVTYIAKLGGSLVDVIKIQAGAMRTKRRQRAEEKAMKTPVKIMIPLVLFIFPSMFIVILGPAALQMIEELVKVPGGGP
jgi:tight adherence protein C